MKIRTTIPKNNKYYMVKSSGGLSDAIKGYPTIPTANVLCNCVGYCNSRFAEIQNDPDMKGIYKPFKYQLVCNAENFIESAKRQGLKISSKPTVGGIMVWQKGATLGSGDGAGHVAIVEEIYKDGSILTSESGWGSGDWAFKNLRRNNSNGRWGQASAYKFRGCIINPSIKGGEPAPTPKLTVDGIGGPDTVMAMQEFFGTYIDGVISGQNLSLKKYYPALKAVSFGGSKSTCAKALQKWVGAAQDGIIGQNTVKALQKKLGIKNQDGIWGSDTMKAWQTYLNNHDKPVYPPTPTPSKKTYDGSYPTSAEIKSASNAGTKERICQWAKKTADSGEYKYKVWTDDVKTHQCPICHNLTGKYKGFNCIGFAWACWFHGGQIPCKCNCGVIDNGTGDKMLKAKTVAAATKMVQNRAGIDDVKVIRNLKTIPASDLQRGDILQYYEGNTYIHALVYVGGNKIADSSRGHTPQVKYGVAYQQKYCKIAIRYTGGKTYLQKYDKGEAVKKIQSYLNWYGNKLAVDGIFGEGTTKAVKAFQKAQNLSQDGIVGQKTIDAMKKVKK